MIRRGPLFAWLCCVTVGVSGCGVPDISALRPQVSKPSALVYLAGNLPGWTPNTVEGAAASEQVVTLVKDVSQPGWGSALQRDVMGAQTPLFVLVQDGPVTSGDLQLAQQFPQRKFLFVGSQMQGRAVPQNAQVVVPNPGMSSYLLGWLAGASAAKFQLASNSSGTLAGTPLGNSASGLLPGGTIPGPSVGSIGTGVPLGWAQGGTPQVSVGAIQSALVGGLAATSTVHPVSVQLTGTQTGSALPQMIVGMPKVIVADRALTVAEWAQIKTVGAMLVSLCPQPLQGPGWMASPMLPSPQVALQSLQQLGQSSTPWQGGGIQLVSNAVVQVNGAAVSQSLQNELARLETNLQTHPVNFTAAWRTVPAAQRAAWQFLWLNAPPT
ncbi:hypothetical protein D2Q93_00345 [Alicyclobacillaceae bacterium I2511]|nr:hypothetical protein D2Q93_00345 [Alicyclobacillaceae bacterium I2511]